MVDRAQRENFLEALKRLDGAAGNGKLCATLQWDEITYASVKDSLIASGDVIPGRGRGGSVKLSSGETTEAPAKLAQEKLAQEKPTQEKPAQEAPAWQKTATSKAAREPRTTSGDLGFEADLFKAADKLRGNLEPSEYKHVALGLIFLKYISEAFEAHHTRLSRENYADPEDPEEYLAENVFWVPSSARWSHLQAYARLPEITFVDVTTGQPKKGDIGGLIDNAMEAIEQANIMVLKDVLPKNYSRPQLDKTMLGELIDLFSNVDMRGEHGQARDRLGRAYEYFISQFAGAEGRRGGEFYTPRSVVQTIVEMLEPTQGRVYDPCCGSGGMFVQSEKFIESH